MKVVSFGSGFSSRGASVGADWSLQPTMPAKQSTQRQTSVFSQCRGEMDQRGETAHLLWCMIVLPENLVKMRKQITTVRPV